MIKNQTDAPSRAGPPASAGNPPHALRRIFRGHAPAIGRLVAADPLLADFVSRQDAAGIHFLALAVSIHMPEEGPALREFAGMLRTLERGKLLRRILRQRLPHGLTSSLKKLGPAPMAADSYNLLLELLHEPNARKALHHTRRITPAILRGLRHLPRSLRLPALARIAGKPEQRQHLDYALAVVRKWRPELDDRALKKSLSAINSPDGFQLWMEHLLLRRPFPSPPWEGDDLLRPIRDRQELRNVAATFRNCLSQYELDVVLGRACFYVWHGDEPCIAEIRRDELLDWRVGEIQGVENKAPTSATRDLIAGRFAGIGIDDFGEAGTHF